MAILYTLLGYLGGITLFFSPQGWVNAIGVLLLTHSLVLSAYLSHEFMHGSILGQRHWNVVFGNVMLWLNGSCYARFCDLTRMHIAHHVDRVDFCRFDLVEYLNRLPAPIRSILLGLEWLYVPALAIVLRVRSMAAPFWDVDRQDERLRTSLILLVRGGLFVGLGVLSLKALLLYCLSYLGMVHILRVVDAFQHTYEVFPVGSPLPERSAGYEQANTFSILVSGQHPWLNLLLLNFSYHNAHHVLMKCPWHSLPDLDRALFSEQEVHYIPLSKLLGNYHRYRVSRIYSGQGQAIDAAGQQQLETFYGAIEVSFLVLPA